MQLDLFTLILATMGVFFSLAFAVLLVDRQTRGHDGLGAWGASLLVLGLIAAALVWSFERIVPAAVIAANMLVSVALALQMRALSLFQARPLSPVVTWGPVFAAAALAVVFAERVQLRFALLGVVYALQLGQVAWLGWGAGLAGPRERARILLVMGSGVLALFFIARSARAVSIPAADFPPQIPTDMVALSFFVTMSAVLVNTVGFLLMQKERAVESLRDQAGRDALTGIANRREFLRLAEASVAQAGRQGTPLALLMVDVDHFKRVNDTHGHLAGDAVLREVADRIRHRVRRQDLLARFGGEEFVLLLAEERRGALALAAQLQDAFRDRPVVIDGKAIPVTLSIGAHVRTPGAAAGTVDGMIAAADRALYSAKQQGRDRIDITD